MVDIGTQQKICVAVDIYELFLSCAETLMNSPDAISIMETDGKIRWLWRLTEILIRESDARRAAIESHSLGTER